MIYFLFQNILKDITESVEKSSPTHRNQRMFISSLQKALSSGKREKELTESALICAIDLFKAGSFVGDRSIVFFRYFITLMQGQLHVRSLPSSYTTGTGKNNFLIGWEE